MATPSTAQCTVAKLSDGLERDEHRTAGDERPIQRRQRGTRHKTGTEDASVDDYRFAGRGRGSLLDGSEVGAAFFFLDIVDHHDLMGGKRPGTAQQLLDRELGVLGMRRMRERLTRHGALHGRCDQSNRAAPILSAASRCMVGVTWLYRLENSVASA